ncbi:hypothetical protein SKA58_04070 [Sphingomonas sp. SKA58]|nr:hypothetical protein SKA58_04070 [Sphingomonas sp. SKA58]|tara:strand:- start:4825 stop:5139 length:315 start_codon:yes stop_codon:yes gene_type:complete
MKPVMTRGCAESGSWNWFGQDRPAQLASCNTALIDDPGLEGHGSTADKKLLLARANQGEFGWDMTLMPRGLPKIGMAAAKPRRFNVIALRPAGRRVHHDPVKEA